ncbi:MAG: cytoskeleton protein RodZ [Acidobacteriota bacterium]|jgi:transcriptional regulator with XRE-family HTH domain|nr:cytoskeleton protein RodZ [Acidobacteriota bacterium]
MPEQETPSVPHSELASFGEELRREREIRGISLKEIADATKISKRFLEAIERNDHRTLPAPVFTRGFVREYARYLGLNSEDMVNRYNFAAAGDDRIEKSIHLDRLTQPPAPVKPVKPLKPRGIPQAYARIDRNVVVTVLIVIALISVAVWAVRNRREAIARIDGAEVHDTVAATHPATLTSAPLPATAPVSPATGDMLRLVVELNDDSWVSLDADGKSVYNDEMHRGDKRTFEAKDHFRFRTIGNAGGLSLTLNDVKVPALGRAGQVLHDRVFDRAWLQNAGGAAPNP